MIQGARLRIKDGRTGTLRVKREKRRVLPSILIELESYAADLPDDSAAARDLIREALSTKPKNKVIEVQKTGWVDRPDVIAFVTPIAPTAISNTNFRRMQRL